MRYGISTDNNAVNNFCINSTVKVRILKKVVMAYLMALYHLFEESEENYRKKHKQTKQKLN